MASPYIDMNDERGISPF